MTTRPPVSLLSLWSGAERFGVCLLGLAGISIITSKQLIRFGVVGICAATTYVAAMATMVGSFEQSIVLSTACAFIIGTSVSYTGNALWSFNAKLSRGNAFRFFAVTSLGFLLNIVIAWSLERLGLHYLEITAIALVVVPLFNFTGHRIVTFRTRGTLTR